MLNSQMDNPLQNVQGSLDAHDLVKFLPHVVPSSESEPQPQQNTLVDGDGVVDTGSNDSKMLAKYFLYLYCNLPLLRRFSTNIPEEIRRDD